MQSGLDHLQINVRAENLDFYRRLLTFVGWTPVMEMDGYFGMAGSNGASLWVLAQVNDAANDYDGPGVNHIGIGVPDEAGVDAAIAYLEENGIQPLFETPRHRPIPGKEGHTYYQVMFESPDRILFEVEYTGPKS